MNDNRKWLFKLVVRIPFMQLHFNNSNILFEKHA